MFARVTTQQGSPDGLDASLKAVQEIVPAAREMSGFERILVLEDRASGKSLGITFWESEEAMRASEEAATTLRASVASAGGADVVSVEHLEVVLDER